MNRTAIDLDDVLRRITSVRAGLAIHGVRNLGVFGSVARRDAGPDSDVDVIIDLDPDHETLDDLVAVADLLEATLGTHVDLVTRNGVSPYIASTIESEVRHVLDGMADTHDHEIDVLSRIHHNRAERGDAAQ